MTTTKTQTFTNKIKSLKDFHARLVSNSGGLPSSNDITSTLKYFHLTLQGLLKDAPPIPPESFGSRGRDYQQRISLFPDLQYDELFYSLIGLCECVGKVANPSSVCDSILKTFSFIIPFLDFDSLDGLPLIIASTLNYFPSNQCGSVMELLCNVVIPMVYTWNEEQDSYAIDSIPAIMMAVFQHVEKPEYHSWLVESFMSKKRDLYRDLLMVIAHGPTESRLPAVCLLFHYWPELCPSIFQSNQALQPNKYKYEQWKPVLCERTDCPNKASKSSANLLKMSVEPSIAAQYANKSPPFYVCLDCADALNRNGVDTLIDVLLPMKQVSMICESKTCRSPKSTAYATCFSFDCTFLNGGRPIRFCETCHIARHHNVTGNAHIVQVPLPDVWDAPLDCQPFMIEAIVSLCGETLPRWRQAAGAASEEGASSGGARLLVEAVKGAGGFHSNNEYNDTPLGGRYSDDDHKALAVYGALLIGEKCKPKKNINIEILGRILASLFNWYHETIYTAEGPTSSKNKGSLQERYELGDLIEKVKSEYIMKWIQDILDTYLEVVLSVLLPHPVEYARVGSYWDTLCDRTAQVKQGLHKLSSLIPYDIVTYETWDYIIPYWLETIRTEVPKENYPQLEILLRKIFDAHAGPFPFLPAKVYHFATERFIHTHVSVQDQVLSWLEILTGVEVVIPMKELISMFRRGVESLRDPLQVNEDGGVNEHTLESWDDPVIVPRSAEDIRYSDPLNIASDDMLLDEDDLEMEEEMDDDQLDAVIYHPLKCFNMMLRITFAQLKLFEPIGHMGILNETSNFILSLLGEMLASCWEGSHTCSTGESRETSVDGNKAGELTCAFCLDCLEWHQLCAKLCEHITPAKPTKLTDIELPQEDKSPEVFKTMDQGKASQKNGPKKKPTATSTEADSVSSPTDSNSPPPPPPPPLEADVADQLEKEEPEPVFDIASMPSYIQVTHHLMTELANQKDSETLKNILKALTYLVRHSEALNQGIKCQSSFIKYSIRKYLIPTLWTLLSSEFSYLAPLSVPLLCHSLTIAGSTDVFWKILEKEFANEDWRVRFDAVERVTILARQLEDNLVNSNQPVLSSLAHAFCNLIGSLDDLNPAVAQRTVFYLDTIKEKSINCVIRCLEFQFDSVISDRSLILLRMHHLSCILKNRPIFSWEFFLNRFAIFSIEAQIGSNKNADISSVTDLNSANKNSDHFREQFNRAKFAISRSDSIRSISSSAAGKPSYRRAVSVPLHTTATPGSAAKGSSAMPHLLPMPPIGIAAHVGKSDDTSKEKTAYSRQASAPQFNIGRRKSKPTLAGLGAQIYQGGVAEFTDHGSKLATNIQLALDLEGSSRDTLHQWVALLLKFMASVDLNQTKDEIKDKKALSRVQRHLALLLGYTEQSFSIPPCKLRSSTVFHAFIAGVSQVLDRNYEMGNTVLHLTLVVLQFCASPQRYASDNQPPTFTLWLLEPHVRLHWLNTLLVILYKYDYSSTATSCGAFKSIVEYLVRIAVNTLEGHVHVCKEPEEGFSPPTSHLARPRDTSTVSMEMDAMHDMGTPTRLVRSGRSTVHYAKPMIEESYEMAVFKAHTTDEDLDSTSQLSSIKGVPVPATATATTSFDRPTALERRISSGKVVELPSITKVIVNPREEHTSSSPTRSISSSVSDVTNSVDQSPSLLEETTGNQTKCNKSKKKKRRKKKKKSLQSSEQPLADSQNLQTNSSVDQKIAEQLAQFQNGRPGNQTQDDDSQENSDKLEESTGTGTTDELDAPRTLEGTKEASVVELKEEDEDEQDDDDENDSQDSLTPPHKPQFRKRKARKSGLTCVEVQKALEEKEHPGRRRPRRAELNRQRGSQAAINSSHVQQSKRPTYQRTVEAFMELRCEQCNAVLEHYDEDALGLAILVMATYVHREPSLAAPHLFDMLMVASKIACFNIYSWKTSMPNIIVPGNAASIARQFLRCTMVHLAPNGLFLQLFQTDIEDDRFFKCIVSVLVDFEEHMNICQPLEIVLDSLNKMKTLPSEHLPQILLNMTIYMEALPSVTDDAKMNHLLASWWSCLMMPFDSFLRRLPMSLTGPQEMTPVLKIMNNLLRSPIVVNHKDLLDSFSLVIRFMIRTSLFELTPLLELCSQVNRIFKERGKSLVTKSIVEELHQALKLKTYIPDENIMLLVQFVLMDAGGTVEPNKISEGLTSLFNPQNYHNQSTGASEFLRAHIADCLSFISDVDTVYKVKQNQKSSGSHSLHEDTLGAHLKSAVAQFVSLEMSKGLHSRGDKDAPPILQYLPWLKSIPPTFQQGPREFLVCVERIRTLSWLLLGSMIHTVVTQNNTGITCQPIPISYNKSVADLVKIILSGFPDQQKQSVIVMSSLYHAFVLCQLWTVYVETAACMHADETKQYTDLMCAAMDFWGKIIPTIIHLLTISDDFVVVNGHLLTIMEELIECRSSVVSKLITLWMPILHGRHKQLPGNMLKRLQKCVEWEPPEPSKEDYSFKSDLLVKWLKKHIFVLGRNEAQQSSAASHIFIT